MAEFKLGRIKFVYKGEWAVATPYLVDDVISVGGNTYICVKSHTSDATLFATDQQALIPLWALASGGTYWDGDWTALRRYELGALVKWGGTVYVCIEAHTAGTYTTPNYYGLEANSDKWEEFATTFSWKGPWSTGTRYKVRDIVTYGGITYVCKTQHISNVSLINGLEIDFANWDVYNAGITYLGTFDGNDYRYKLNDVVKYGSDLWICTAAGGYRSTTSFVADQSNWGLFVNGLQFENSWSGSSTYQIGDIVTYGGYAYICKQNHSTSQTPSTATAYWGLYTTTFNFQSDWITATNYRVGDVVRVGGYTYVATADSNSETPPSAKWVQLNSGIKWRSITGSYTAVAGTNIIGGGSSATFNITRNNTVYTVVKNATGSGYALNDTIKILGTQVGGQSPVNDIIITVTGVSGNAVDTISSTGFASTWAVSTAYVLGDITFWGANSYICVSAHVASAPTRPDNDTSATYWNLFAAGAEAAVLTTQGDTFYYGPSGPTRLPAGTEGQVLRVKDGYPAWQYYGLVNNLVYVASTGTDDETIGQGSTIDKPWKTVRFAAEQVEKGYQNRQAKALIEKNKQFLLKEVNNFVSYTFKATVSGTSTGAFTTSNTSGLRVNMPVTFGSQTGSLTLGGSAISSSTVYYVKTITTNTSFTVSSSAGGALVTAGGTGTAVASYSYSSSKTERDAGYIVDAIAFDLSHGGNLKTTTAALAYYSATSTNTYASGVLSAEITEFVEALQYLSTITLNVLANTAPAANYQTLNSATPTADQIIDSTLTAETGITTTVSNLIAIVTSGLSAGTSTAIATAIQPNTTISVKTGTYNEVLPIVVAANAAVVGDELRGTVIQPNTAIASLVNDKPKTIAALNRIKAVVPTLISNSTVTPTTGNTQTQVTTLPVGSVGSTTATARVVANAELMYDIIDNGLTEVPSAPAITSIATASASAGAGTATIGFSAQSAPPYVVGQLIKVYGVTPTAYNGFWTVTACTTTSVSFISTATGSQTVAGTVANVGTAFTFAPPTGYNVSVSAGYGDGLTQIIQNYAFIKAEISAYLAATAPYSTVWAALSAAQQAACQRDVGYILDALQYDMIYGGNTQSLIAGAAYYSNSVLTIASGEQASTLAAYARLKTIVGQIVTKTAVSVTAGNAVSQVTTGNTGSAGASTFAQARIQDIYDYINTGTAPATTSPDTTWATSALQASYAAVQTAKTEIQSDTVVWVKKFYQNLSFNTTTCSRDAGLIVNALAYDMVFGTNFNSIKAGMSYLRSLTSTGVVIASQKTAELGAIQFIKYKVKHLAGAGATAQISNLIDDITSFIDGGAQPRYYWPDFTSVDAEDAAAAKLIWNNSAFIKAEIIQYITTNYGSLTYSQTACARDVGYIVDALRYDLTYGGKYASKQAGVAYYSRLTNAFEIASSEKTATLAAYGQLKTLVQALAGGTAYTALQTSTVRVLGTNGDATSSTRVGALVDVITNIINSGLTNGVPKVTITTVAGGTTFTSGTHGLSVGDEVIPQTTPTSGNGGYGLVAGTTYYVASTPLTTTFTLAATQGGAAITSFTNGTGLSIGAEITNLPSTSWVASAQTTSHTALQTAKATIKTAVTSYIATNFPALTYDSATCARDVGYIVDAIGYDFMFDSNFRSIKAGLAYFQAQASLVVGSQKTATIAAFNYLKLQIAGYLTSNATALARANTNMQYIINILDKGVGETPEVFGTNAYDNTLGTIKGAEILRANRTFLAYEATAYITQSYGGTVSTTTASSDLFTTSAAHNFVVGDPVVFSGTAYSGSGVNTGTTYYVLTVPSTTTFTVAASQSGTVIDVTSNGSGSSLIVRYSYDATSCRRDMLAYVDAIVYDLNYTGNYKSLRAAQLYKNAVSGSLLENMFLVRNGSGLRNMTMSGLTGTLTNANSYGTKRPTAGAYSSLDPGFGPNDTNVWISSRSCYTQNCTMFGTGCSGMKIDAALHSSGNKSIVANDYTTIISDGIGVWATGSGALTELVSVFNYYGYAGYLAELGARMRATNGNSSYGTYGVIAEGTDTFETAIVGAIDNRAAEAQITNVVTDAINQILRIEYSNAGTGYTNSVATISGSGYNAAATHDEFRDAAIFETRLIDTNDGDGYGGTSYTTTSNTSQGGSIGKITLAATDVALNNAYAGMRIQLTAGTGVGQYANILTFSNGSKDAYIYKDSFTNLTISATTNGAPSTVTVASTATLYANMPFMVGSAVGGLAINTIYYVKTIINATTFSVSSTSGGTAFTTEITTTTSQSVTLYAAGWDHVVPGNTVSNNLDLTSVYIVEPRISYAAPGYVATARTTSGTGVTWQAATYGAGKYVAVANGSTTTSYSSDGKTWANGGVLTTTTYTDVVYGGGEGATATAIVGGLGGTGAVLTAVLGTGATATQIVSVTIVSGGVNYLTPPTIVFSGTGAGATATCTVLNGVLTSVTMTINGSGYTGTPTVTAATDRVTSITVNTSGKNYASAPTVTLTGGGSSNQATATATLTNAGVSSIAVGNSGGSGYTSTPTVTILDTSARFVAIATTANNSCYQTVAGLGSATAWTAGGSTAKTDLKSIAFGNGLFVAVGGTTGTASAVSSTDATSWISRTPTALSAGYYSGIAYGNGYFVAVNNGGQITSVCTTPTSWSAGGTLPSLFTSAVSIAYGNGRFVVLGSDGKVAYSTNNGTTWTASPTCSGTTTSILSSTYTWNAVRYGQGTFFAIAQGTSVCATSPDGINWTVRAMSSSSNWKALAFGNTSNNPLWAAVSATSGTVACSMNTGATALGRVKVASNVVTEIRMIEPGSAYPKGTVTATTTSTNVITVSTTENLVNLQPIEFTGCTSGGLSLNTTYYVIGSTIVTNTSFKVADSAANAALGTAVALTTATGLTGTFRAGPIATITDPNKVKTAKTRVRQGDGALGNPSFSNRGTGNTTATATTAGDGYADLYQPASFINVSGLYSIPQAGCNVEFASISNTWYKLVGVTNVLGSAGAYTATFQINPALTVYRAPAHGDVMTTKLKYSQVRLTGHDFLYIGTGNKTQTNYPYVDATTAVQSQQSNSSGGGRVFFTSTDQDGNFNVGNLFGVQQATGTATLNANAFNLAGLQSLQLGAVSIGVGSAVITQFSTDPYFTANSDNIVPTQKAIKAYITAQIGGGSSSLNVNTLTAGQIYIANNSISNTLGNEIKVTSKMNFVGGIDGAPVALSFFMQK
jgi:hypothetical protein